MAVHDSFLQFVLSRKTVDDEEIDGELGRFDFEASGAPTPSPPINTSSTVSVCSPRQTGNTISVARETPILRDSRVFSMSSVFDR